ncbi:MAG: hypothetical protein A2Z47_08510 [Thermodesulfovibrio sp. RBG_19FT_COMBO_42_12]|nr:MAG: hypothetical protein A2Z47_08510 [Thermodesulfovibrio sp. RBG_19FT_COMBO_42_12]HZX49180.1 hypothetical protein [Nitrospirota bacterium]
MRSFLCLPCFISAVAQLYLNEEILKYAVHAKETHNSAVLNLEELGDIFRRAKESNYNVARIHYGDPAIYGAIHEQMKLLTGVKEKTKQNSQKQNSQLTAKSHPAILSLKKQIPGAI